MLTVVYAKYCKLALYAQRRYTECRKQAHYVECYYAECRYTECRGALLVAKRIHYFYKSFIMADLRVKCFKDYATGAALKRSFDWAD